MDRQTAATLTTTTGENMDTRIVDRKISCPFCAEPMSIVIDLSAGDQSYVEDCQICCQAMQICFESDGEQLHSLQVDCAG